MLSIMTTGRVLVMILLEAMWHRHCWLTIDGISSLTLVRPVDAFVSRCYGQQSLIRGDPRGIRPHQIPIPGYPDIPGGLGLTRYSITLSSGQFIGWCRKTKAGK